VVFAALDKVIHRMVQKYWRSVGEVDDLVQEVWLRVITHLPRLRANGDPARMRAWLHRLVQSRAVDHLRKQRCRNLLHPLEALAAGATPRDHSDPVRQLERGLQRDLARRLLCQLRREVSPENYRIFEMYWIEEQEVPTIAEAVGIKPDVVSARLYRTMKKMRALSELERAEYHGRNESW
jgi:RNA polymerase sigma-70 factor (ECF subfamily)